MRQHRSVSSIDLIVDARPFMPCLSHKGRPVPIFSLPPPPAIDPSRSHHQNSHLSSYYHCYIAVTSISTWDSTPMIGIFEWCPPEITFLAGPVGANLQPSSPWVPLLFEKNRKRSSLSGRSFLRSALWLVTALGRLTSVWPLIYSFLICTESSQSDLLPQKKSRVHKKGWRE